MDTQQVQQQIDQAKSIAKIEVMVTDMHERLFGNGQPGELDKLSKRVTSLEHDRSVAKGGFAVLTTFVGFIGWAHIRDLFR